jgi:hypothetical protein
MNINKAKQRKKKLFNFKFKIFVIEAKSESLPMQALEHLTVCECMHTHSKSRDIGLLVKAESTPH